MTCDDREQLGWNLEKRCLAMSSELSRRGHLDGSVVELRQGATCCLANQSLGRFGFMGALQLWLLQTMVETSSLLQYTSGPCTQPVVSRPPSSQMLVHDLQASLRSGVCLQSPGVLNVAASTKELFVRVFSI